MNSNLRNKGFTVLEVLISIFILTFIALAIYNLTTETFKLRDILAHEGDFYNSIRLSMGILDRDISLMYSPSILVANQPPSNPAEMEQLMATDLGRANTFWGPAVDKTGIRPMRFQGTSEKLTFVSLSHLRVYKDSPESEFAKISYELLPDNSNPDDTGARILTKTEDTNAFDEDAKLSGSNKSDFKHTYPLLHGVRKLVFTYYSKEKDQWLTSWDSDSVDQKNTYPLMIKATVEVKTQVRRDKMLSFEGVYQFKPEIPFNGLDPST